MGTWSDYEIYKLQARIERRAGHCSRWVPLPTSRMAQSYPTRPIRFIVPFPAGGVADVTARLIGQRLGEALGQTIIVENRTGASGTLGVDAATKATPDGYTLLFTTGDFITTPTLMPKVNFDPYKDLIPIVQVATAPLLLGAHAAGSIGSVQELIAQAKGNPDKIAYSSPGNGTINQLAVEWIGIEAKLKFLHVPYRGGAPAAVAVAAGDVPIGAPDSLVRAASARGGQGQGAGTDDQAPARRSHRRRGRRWRTRASRSTPRSGSRCSRRPARRKRSSIGWIRRCCGS